MQQTWDPAVRLAATQSRPQPNMVLRPTCPALYPSRHLDQPYTPRPRFLFQRPTVVQSMWATMISPQQIRNTRSTMV